MSPALSFAGGKFYFNTSDYDEEAQRSVEKLWCVDAAAGTMSELTGYAPPAAAQESEDSYSYINSVAAAENGDLLVSETVSMTVFELPEGFSGTEEEKYEYADYVSTDYLRLLDSTGAEKSIVRPHRRRGGRGAEAPGPGGYVRLVELPQLHVRRA